MEGRQYRVRAINGSNSRTYRLVLLDEGGRPVNDAMRQIGADAGLFGRPVKLPPGGLVLASAERADLIVDFSQHRGQRLRLVNTAGSPFDGASFEHPPGTPDPANRLPYPNVMEFRISSRRVSDPFTLPGRLASFRRLTPERLPRDHVVRLAALVENDGWLTLLELQAIGPGDEQPGEPIVEIVDRHGTATRYRTMAVYFEDTTNWFVEYDATEVWQFINLSPDSHPMHVHLVHFQALGRERYDRSGFDSGTGATSTPVKYLGEGQLDDNELGWKDTIRVNPGELVSIAATFTGFTGLYMYHCHLLEHEDHDMMRPFVVMPASAASAMGMPNMTRPRASAPPSPRAGSDSRQPS